VTTPLPELKPPASLPDELRGCTSFLLARAGYVIKLRAIEEFEREGVSLWQYSVLAVLGEGDRETQATIADALGLDRSQLVGVLDSLEEGGWIERRRDPNDRRRHTVSLTADGKRQLSKMRQVVSRVEDSFFAPLDERSKEALRAILMKLVVNFERR
jgi:MarR family transcriptional regulator, lower aerobic nicotinate degradation pathway regulator